MLFIVFFISLTLYVAHGRLIHSVEVLKKQRQYFQLLFQLKNSMRI